MSSNGSKRKIKVQVSIPNAGYVVPEAYDNRICQAFHLGGLQLASHLGVKEYSGMKYEYPEGVEYEFFWASVGRVLTPLARERLTEWAIKTNMDYMLMIDDDMICPMDLFEKLVRHNVDVVAPLAFMRMAPHMPVIYRLDEGYDSMSNMNYYVTEVIKNYPKNRLVECDAVGFGAALIKVDVVKKMSKPYFMSTTSTGEDLWFCKRAKEIGAHVYMDTGVKLGHMGLPPIIEEKDFDREFKSDEHREIYGEWKEKVKK